MNFLIGFIYLIELQREGETRRERTSICWSIPQVATQLGQGQMKVRNKELHLGLWHGMGGLGSSSAFPRPIEESWIGGGAETQTVALTGCCCHRWQLYLLSHSTSPKVILKFASFYLDGLFCILSMFPVLVDIDVQSECKVLKHEPLIYIKWGRSLQE